MARLTLTLHAAHLHDMRRDNSFLWGALNPDEGKPQRPWVARLTGFDDRYTFARDFVRGEFAAYNRKSAQTRDTVYDLAPGLYEVNAPTAYDQADRYYLVVEPDGASRRVDKGAAMAYLMDAQPTAADLARLLLEDDEHERS